MALDPSIGDPEQLQRLYELFKRHIYGVGTQQPLAQVRFEPGPDDTSSRGSLDPEVIQEMNNLANQLGSFGHTVTASVAQLEATLRLLAAVNEQFGYFLGT